MFGFLKNFARSWDTGPAPGTDKTGRTGEPPTDTADELPGVWKMKNGTLSPEKLSTAKASHRQTAQKETQMHGSNPHSNPPPGSSTSPAGLASAPASSGPGSTMPDVSQLNQKVVQAVEFTNYENLSAASDMVSTPPDMMVAQATGLVVQNAENYLNAIMQIAVAGQAVAIKKAAKGPLQAVEEIPLMKDIQNMVSEAAKVYKTVSTDAGTAAKTVIKDLGND